jgi:PPOX class probable F420-dependent enzyme
VTDARLRIGPIPTYFVLPGVRPVTIIVAIVADHPGGTGTGRGDPMTVPADIVRSKYVSLTTRRKDGRTVATPVWHVVHGDEVWIISEARAGKVKRIRNNGDVVLAVCDLRGNVAPDAPRVNGHARLLDEEDTRAGRVLLGRKYATSRFGNWFARILHLRRPPMIGIAVTF